MHSENIGMYIDKATGAEYKVLKRTTAVNQTSNDKPATKVLFGSESYVTACGQDLNSRSKDDSEFEICKTGNLIHRQ